MILADLPFPILVLTVGIVALAGMVRGFAGFGSALIMTPILSSVFGPSKAVPIGLTLEILLTVPFWPKAVRLVDWRRMAPLAISAALAVPVGTAILVRGDAEILRYVMAGTVMLAVLILGLGWRYRGYPHPIMTLATGAFSGTLNGAVGMAGPPVVFYYLSGEDKAGTIRASLLIYFTLIDLVALIALATQDIPVTSLWQPILILAPCFLAAAYAGAKLFDKAHEQTYRRVALIILTGVACSSIFL